MGIRRGFREFLGVQEVQNWLFLAIIGVGGQLVELKGKIGTGKPRRHEYSQESSVIGHFMVSEGLKGVLMGSGGVRWIKNWLFLANLGMGGSVHQTKRFG